jgi:hypothetical protein
VVLDHLRGRDRRVARVLLPAAAAGRARTAALVTVLYCFFAYKNLGAIKDVTDQRLAIHRAIVSLPGDRLDVKEIDLRPVIEPTLLPPEYPGVRNFHVASDVLTIAAIWAMERRRVKAAKAAPLV